MRPALFLLIVLLTACADNGTGDLANHAALDGSEYIALDLATGTLAALPADTGADLESWRQRDDRMLFRRVPLGEYIIAVEDMDPQQDSFCAFPRWLAVFEITSAQWSRLARQAPSDQRLPVTGIAPAEIAATIAAFPLPTWRLLLPDDNVWVAAASDGNRRLFAWGDGAADLQAATYAVCLRSDNTTPGLQMVGSLPATGRGFCDMHGNAWELIYDDVEDEYAIRGGGWDSPALNCRTANRITVPPDLAHPLVGFRLALGP